MIQSRCDFEGLETLCDRKVRGRPPNWRTKSGGDVSREFQMSGVVIVLLICSSIPLVGRGSAGDFLCAICQSTGSSSERVSSKTPNAAGSIKFEQGNMGEIGTADGIDLGFTNFKASDGVDLRVLYWDFDDEMHAAQALEKQIVRAAKIIKREPKRDSIGKVVGQRMLVVLPQVNHHEALSAVFWTDGVSYHEIRSVSRKDILELERVYKYR
jgi:hypothetical protein